MRRLCMLGALGLLTGAITGGIVGWRGHRNSRPAPRRIPSPHLVPQIPQGTALRFVMVHDVLHQRFAKHGRAYYEQRNERVRKLIAVEEQEERTGEFHHLNFLDDLGVGLERVGESVQAVGIMRQKLALQTKTEQSWQQIRQERLQIPPSERPSLNSDELSLYRTYANLGTFLIHSAFPKAITGDTTARQTMREGLEYIKKAVEVNPGAHFGRENWQVTIAEFMLAVFESPELLREFDMVGNRLDAEISVDGSHYVDGWAKYWNELPDSARLMQELRDRLEDAQIDSYRHEIRGEWITRVGADPEWVEAVGGTLTEPAAFDEPVLGMLGMWTLGGGANPHFALALGGIMERVGQTELAWVAYQRALGMSNRFSSSAEIREHLAEHCRQRQSILERHLAEESGDDVSGVRKRLVEKANKELEFGTSYQTLLADYEERLVAAGESLDGEDSYASFQEGWEKLATPVGEADLILDRSRLPLRMSDLVPMVVLFAGIGALLAVLSAGGFRRKRRVPDSHDPSRAP